MLFNIILKEKGNIKKISNVYKATKKIKHLDLFDDEFYLNKYPQIKNANIDPLYHYLYYGFKENKETGNVFDPNFYLSKYSDVKQSGQNPLIHYVLHGKKEGRLINNKEDNNENFYKISQLENTISHQQDVLDSYQRLFNILFVFNETESKGVLKYSQLICLEILKFVDNVCRKHDIDYWLDFGNLLGYVRHNGYLPWDDDVDIGMIREDYIKFLEVLNEEIQINGLSDKFLIKKMTQTNDSFIVGFIQLVYKPNPNFSSIIGIDVFPYEYVKLDDKLSKDNIEEVFHSEVSNFYLNLLNKNFTEEEAFKVFNKNLHISDSKESYIIPGADSFTANFRLYKTKDVFPIKKVKFEHYDILAPNNPSNYVGTTYGSDYMVMPQVLDFHQRIYALLKIDNIDNILKEEIEKLKEINKNFD